MIAKFITMHIHFVSVLFFLQLYICVLLKRRNIFLLDTTLINGAYTKKINVKIFNWYKIKMELESIYFLFFLFNFQLTFHHASTLFIVETC